MSKKQVQNFSDLAEYKHILNNLVTLIEKSRCRVARTVNAIMTSTYWEIGKYIVETEQKGKKRANYGDELLRQLALDLSKKFGRGFSRQNLQRMRQFYVKYPPKLICSTVSSKLEINKKNIEELSMKDLSNAFPLSWSHYVRLLSLKNNEARKFYEEEALRGGWSLRQLNRQISSKFYERVLLSRNKAKMLKKGQNKLPEDIVTAEEEIKDPFILEFLNLKDEYSEKELEEALLNHLENFLLELGNDFAFVGRQRRLRVGNQWYRVDLLLFHRKLSCLVIVELKLHELNHSDAGQIHMYLNYAREHWTHPHENPPVGLILCTEKDEAVAHYTLEGLPNKVLAAEYRMSLPDEKTLIAELKKTRKLLEGYPQSEEKILNHSSSYITQDQINILKAKVKQKGTPVSIWRKFNKAFCIKRYKFLPKSKFQEAVNWIESS